MAYFVTQGNWAKVVKSRDGNRCIYCGSTEKLETHHIKSRTKFPDDALDIENGVTLCHKCHYTAHAGNYATYQLFGGGHRGLSCDPRVMNAYIFKYAETVKCFIPPSDINKLTLSGDILSVAVGAAWRAGDKGATAFIRRAVESTAAREFEMWQKKQAAILLLESARTAACTNAKSPPSADASVAAESCKAPADGGVDWAARTERLRATREAARASAGISEHEQWKLQKFLNSRFPKTPGPDGLNSAAGKLRGKYRTASEKKSGAVFFA